MSVFVPERRPMRASQRREPLDIQQAQDRLRRLLDETFGGMLPVDGQELWTPPVDIEEQDDAYVVEAEVPGVKKNDVQIEYAGNELTISGEIKEQERKGVLRRQTRRTGAFQYRVVLPEEVDGEHIEANLHDGVLTIRAPKAQKAERRKIEIKG
jgi:HSP20 family protein